MTKYRIKQSESCTANPDGDPDDVTYLVNPARKPGPCFYDNPAKAHLFARRSTAERHLPAGDEGGHDAAGTHTVLRYEIEEVTL